MTGPAINIPNLGSAQVTQVGGGFEQYLPLIMQALQFSKQRKLRKAETALGTVAPGAKFGELSPEEQKQVQYATGRKWQPDEVVSPIPLTPDEASVNRLIASLGLPEGSAIVQGIRGAQVARAATGQPHALATPTDLTTELAGTGAQTRATASQQQSFESAVAKTNAATAGSSPPAEYTPGELAAYQRFNNFVPSQPIADQLSGSARAEVMKQALRLASDPDSASFAQVLGPLGIKPSDAIGAFALGIGSVLDVAIGRQASIQVTNAQEAARALYATAEDVSKKMGGAYSPDFIAHVMEGDPKALSTPAGQLVQKFTNAGFMTAFTENALKGDPASISMTRLLELARVPQIASNEALLSQYSNLIQQSLAASLTRAYVGTDRPTQPGPEQKLWDQTQAVILKQTAGVFDHNWLKGLVPTGTGINIKPSSQPSPEEQRQSNDMNTVNQALQAIFGDSLQPGFQIPTTGAGIDSSITRGARRRAGGIP